jgi:hypothetical protein
MIWSWYFRQMTDNTFVPGMPYRGTRPVHTNLETMKCLDIESTSCSKFGVKPAKLKQLA